MSYSPSTRRHFDRAFGQLITSTASLSATSKARRRAVFAPGGQADERLFPTLETAQSAALEIKKAFPILQMSIYDNVTKSSALMELPAASARRP
jgi:hypothetical protein